MSGESDELHTIERAGDFSVWSFGRVSKTGKKKLVLTCVLRNVCMRLDERKYVFFRGDSPQILYRT